MKTEKELKEDIEEAKNFPKNAINGLLLLKLRLQLKTLRERNAEVKQVIPNIIEDCIIIKMKDVPEHMVGIDLTWLDKEVGRIKNRLEQQLLQKLGLDEK